MVAARAAAYDSSMGKPSTGGDARASLLRLLTPRESEVLRRAAVGRTNMQVAGELGISVHAVKFHLASVFKKLGVRNRTEAAVAFLADAREREDTAL